jgi:hypothetical protein
MVQISRSWHSASGAALESRYAPLQHTSIRLRGRIFIGLKTSLHVMLGLLCVHRITLVVLRLLLGYRVTGEVIPIASASSNSVILLQVKNKYLKEQRINPKRVHEAMTTRDVDMLKKLTEMAQNGDCTQVGRPALLTAGEGKMEDGEEGAVPDVPDADEDELEALGLCSEEVNPGRRAFFY